MANPEHLDVVRQGVDAIIHWRIHHEGTKLDLERADLAGAKLAGAYLDRAWLHRANLVGADLKGAVLDGAVLTMADLTRADLSGALLVWADLTGANLTGADLRHSLLSRTIMLGTDLTNADLSGAGFGSTVFGDIDLSRATGLESVRHHGPSSVGIDTIFLSGGNIPEVFLRGAGVPDDFIVYVRALTRRAFEFYSCFISYSTKDQEFAERLYNDLQAKGVRCWFAPHDIQGGKKTHEQIDQAIRIHDKLLLVLSPHSIASQWVEHEIRRARRREVRENCRVLFAVRLVDFDSLRDWECFDADTGKDSAAEIREYFIPDFSTWKQDHDAYRKAFERLLRDLKSESASQVPAS